MSVPSPVSDLRLGFLCRGAVALAFAAVEEPIRVLLANLDYSGSMGGYELENVKLVQMALDPRPADVVILHEFHSSSDHLVYATDRALAQLPGLRQLKAHGRSAPVQCVQLVPGVFEPMLAFLRGQQARGGTRPEGHAVFLQGLAGALAGASVELTVVSTSDGGINGGGHDSMTTTIQTEMQRVVSTCIPVLMVNLLVGSGGSPEALSFFAGAADRFSNRILFHTSRVQEGVLRFGGAEGQQALAACRGAGVGEGIQYTINPATPFFDVQEVEGVASIYVYFPEGTVGDGNTFTVTATEAKGSRRIVRRGTIAGQTQRVIPDTEARNVFALIAGTCDDNVFVRETSRETLNGLIAQLERLSPFRAAALAQVTAAPEMQARLATARVAWDQNTADIKAVVEDESLTPRDRASRTNALNNARRLLREGLAALEAQMEQDSLEQEETYNAANPDSWVVWLQPAIDLLKGQLVATQKDPGSVLEHLSTRIQTAKSKIDGKERSADRYAARLLAQTRDRNDARGRRADPKDLLQFSDDLPGAIFGICPVSGTPFMSTPIVGLPFVADRRDLTSGNIVSGGQNVDRMPIPDVKPLALDAARALMWGELGQMATPFTLDGSQFFNAVIPTLPGPATPAGMRTLEKAIGWLGTGTSAYETGMAEAIPGALAVLLGGPSDAPALTPNQEMQAYLLLSTTALFDHLRWSYPYVAGTAVFNETVPKRPLPEVWKESVVAAGTTACLATFGCITSYFARAVVVADTAAMQEQVINNLTLWGLRNVARSMVRGGKEGVSPESMEALKQLIALTGVAVDIEGSETVASAAQIAWMKDTSTVGEPLSYAKWPETGRTQTAAPNGELPVTVQALRAVLDSYFVYWNRSCPTPSTFVDALGAWLREDFGTQPAIAVDVAAHLGEILARFDEVFPAPVVSPAAPVVGDEEEEDDEDSSDENSYDDESGDNGQTQPASPSLPGRPHFGIPDLNAVAPTRISTPRPRLADQNLARHRRTFGGETTWIAPGDAALPIGVVNPSLELWLSKHSAFAPLRAFLRLQAAGLLGLPALKAMRTRGFTGSVIAVPQILVQAGIESRLMYRRILDAWNFVLSTVNGYADKAWVSWSPNNGRDVLSQVGCPAPTAVGGKARRTYGKAPLAPCLPNNTWPRLDANGCLPKSRAIDGQGKVILPFQKPILPLTPLIAATPSALCAWACTGMLRALETHGKLILGGLHRQARGLLGECVHDLSGLDVASVDHIIYTQLIPALAGRVKGDPHHPEFFYECEAVFRQLIALGTDTRIFRMEEPAEFLDIEAQTIRAALQAVGAP